MDEPKRRGAGRANLILAARSEFETVGYEDTNSNLIARRAGYAPQTFYRHFPDKLAIFIAVYEAWTEAELAVIAGPGDITTAVQATLAHHRSSQVFRRTLRDLSVRHPELADARAASRRRQLDGLGKRFPAFGTLSAGAQAARLLSFERLFDAIVEGEFERLGVADAEAEALLVDEVRRLSKA